MEEAKGNEEAAKAMEATLGDAEAGAAEVSPAVSSSDGAAAPAGAGSGAGADDDSNGVNGDKVGDKSGGKGKGTCLGMQIPAWWSNSYLMDWMGVVIMVAIIIAINGPIDWLKKQPINMADLGISAALHGDRVTMVVVGLLIIIPGGFVALLFWFKRRDEFEDAHALGLAGLTPIVLAYVVWAVIGNATGELRPDFLARCAPTCMQGFTWECAPDLSLYEASCDSDCCPVQCNRDDPRYEGAEVKCTYFQNGVDKSNLTIEQTCNLFWHIPVTEEIADCNGFQGDSGYDKFSIREGYKSMPSGHTQVIFNAAGTFACVCVCLLDLLII